MKIDWTPPKKTNVTALTEGKRGLILVGYYLNIPVMLNLDNERGHRDLRIKLGDEWLSCDDLQEVFYAIHDHYNGIR